MESINTNKSETPEDKFEQLSGKEKFKAVLELFGGESATSREELQNRFIALCKRYIEARDKANRLSNASEAYLRKQAVISSPRQADIHNEIMGTLTRLSSQSEHKSPLQEAILRKMADRDVTAQIIREYVASVDSTVSEDEEEEGGGRKEGMTDIAYYRSLGKGY